MNQQSPQTRPNGVLLVHGAWHTAHAWDGVVAGLRVRGIPVSVAELHRGSLRADIAATEIAVTRLAEAGRVIACGHSYGGAVISGLDPERIAHLVYLAAVMPDVGESALGLMATAPPTELVRSIVGDPDGTTTIDPSLAGELFYSHLHADQRTRHVSGLVPQLMSPGHDASISAAWRARPSTYVVCADDRVVHPDLQCRLSARATRTVVWNSDHAAFASHEFDTVELLAKLATCSISPDS